MERKTKIIIGVVAAILVVLIAGFLLLGNADVTLLGDGSQVTLPSNYTVDELAVATAGDTSVMFTPVSGATKDSEAEFYSATKTNGKDAGYQNVTSSKINGYKVYEFAANPNKLKNVSTDEVTSGDTTTWKTFEPYLPFGSDAGVDHYRMITFVKDGKVNYLTFYTDNPDTSLYTPEIDAIIHSIGPIQE